ncbi:MAG: hypothetical protein ACRDV8_10690 [Acidimicrobiales bacterium]
MASGVKVVGGTDVDVASEVHEPGGAPERREAEREAGAAGAAAPDLRGRRATGGRKRKGAVVLACIAVLGIFGTVGFGLAWAGLHARASGEAQAEVAARSFLVDLTNFDAKTVDADFAAITSMATGPFSTQAQKFFNSTIRQELEQALASSRGQLRAIYVQSYGTGQASIYAVVDQLYANDKVTSPQTDVLRMVLTMSQVSGSWKVADVTVLQGPTLAPSSGSPKS